MKLHSMLSQGKADLTIYCHGENTKICVYWHFVSKYPEYSEISRMCTIHLIPFKKFQFGIRCQHTPADTDKLPVSNYSK